MGSRILNAYDRCEERGCGAQAYFRAQTLDGVIVVDLCCHHAKKHEDALLDYVWIDERMYINAKLDVSP